MLNNKDHRLTEDISDFLSYLRVDPLYMEPCKLAAEEFRRKKSVLHDKRAGRDQLSVWSSPEQFKIYGPGVFLFMKFLQLLTILMFICLLISLPAIVYNYNGNGINSFFYSTAARALTTFTPHQGAYTNQSQQSAGIMKLSIANQPYFSSSQLNSDPQKQRQVYNNKWVIMGTDLAVSIIFFGFVVFWRVYSKMLVLETMEGGMFLPSYFTIFIENLPGGYTQHELLQHFQAHGVVAEVSSVRSISGLINAIKCFDQAVTDFHKKVLQKCTESEESQLYQALLSKYSLIKDEYCKTKASPYLSAFVSFEQLKTQKNILNLADKDPKSEKNIFKDKILSIQPASIQPINIAWENFHLSRATQIAKTVLLIFLLIVILVVGLAALFYIKVNSVTDFVVQKRQYTFQEVQSLGTQRSLDTFCYKLSFRILSPQYFRFCQKSFGRYIVHLMSSVSFSLVIVIVNFIIGLVLRQIVDLRRYSTKTARDRFLILMSLAFLFFNKVLLPLLVQGQVGNLSLKYLFQKMFHTEANLLQVTLYNHFSRKWYLQIGTQVMMNFGVSLIVCPVFWILTTKFMQIVSRVRAHFSVIQKDMNEMLLDSEFNFNQLYATTLTVVFFTLFYSTGIPLFYLMAGLSMLIIYYVSKIIFIRMSQQPTMFDHSLNQTVTWTLPVALLMHQILSSSFITNPQIFPVIPYPSDSLAQKIVEKLESGWLFYIIAAGLAIYVVLQGKFDRFVDYYVQKAAQKSPNLAQIVQQGKNHTHNFTALRNMNQFLYSYRIENNPEYQDILSILEKLTRPESVLLAGDPTVLKEEMKIVLGGYHSCLVGPVLASQVDTGEKGTQDNQTARVLVP